MDHLLSTEKARFPVRIFPLGFEGATSRRREAHAL